MSEASMTARPTPERLAEIRAIVVGMGSWGIPGAMETYPWPSYVGESEALDAIRDLLAEVDALTAERDMLAIDAAGLRKERDAVSSATPRLGGVWLTDADFQASVVDLAEARAILADLYALAEGVDHIDNLIEHNRLLKIRNAVLERCRPKGES